MLYLGWFNWGSGSLTAPREMTYDPTQQKILVLPVTEMALLRGKVLGHKPAGKVTQGKDFALFDNGETSTTFDMEVNVTLTPQKPVRFGASIMASNASNAEVILKVNISTAEKGLRVVNMSVGVPFAGPRQSSLNVTYSFLFPDAPTLPLRILADRSIVEIFLGGGRGIVTTGVLAPGKDPSRSGVFLTTESDEPVELNSAAAWSMNCGWM